MPQTVQTIPASTCNSMHTEVLSYIAMYISLTPHPTFAVRPLISGKSLKSMQFVTVSLYQLSYSLQQANCLIRIPDYVRVNPSIKRKLYSSATNEPQEIYCDDCSILSNGPAFLSDTVCTLPPTPRITVMPSPSRRYPAYTVKHKPLLIWGTHLLV